MAKKFRKLGWKRCITARYGDRSMDDLGIDLLKTQPFAIQCHAGRTIQIAKFDKICPVGKSLEEEGYQIPLYIFKRPRREISAILPWRKLEKLIYKDKIDNKNNKNNNPRHGNDNLHSM